MKEVSELLGKFFDSRALQEGQEYVEFTTKWRQIIGNDLADHIKVYDLKNGVLITETDHPGWAQMFLLRKKGIIRKIQHEYPELNVNNVQVRYKDQKVREHIPDNIQYPVREKNVVEHEETDKNHENDDGFFNILDKFKERAQD